MRRGIRNVSWTGVSENDNVIGSGIMKAYPVKVSMGRVRGMFNIQPVVYNARYLHRQVVNRSPNPASDLIDNDA